MDQLVARSIYANIPLLNIVDEKTTLSQVRRLIADRYDYYVKEGIPTIKHLYILVNVTSIAKLTILVGEYISAIDIINLRKKELGHEHHWDMDMPYRAIPNHNFFSWAFGNRMITCYKDMTLKVPNDVDRMLANPTDDKLYNNSDYTEKEFVRFYNGARDTRLEPLRKKLELPRGDILRNDTIRGTYNLHPSTLMKLYKNLALLKDLGYWNYEALNAKANPKDHSPLKPISIVAGCVRANSNESLIVFNLDNNGTIKDLQMGGRSIRYSKSRNLYFYLDDTNAIPNDQCTRHAIDALNALERNDCNSSKLHVA